MKLSLIATGLCALDYVHYRKEEHTYRTGGNQLFPIYYQVMSGICVAGLLNQSDALKSSLGRKRILILPLFLITQLSIATLLSSKAIHSGVSFVKNLPSDQIQGISLFVESISPRLAPIVQKIQKLASALHPCTSLLKEKMESGSFLYRTTHTVHQYLPSLLQILAITASIGLFREGKKAEGQIALGILATDCIFTHMGLIEDAARGLRKRKWERLGNAFSTVILPVSYYLSPIKINFYWLAKQSPVGHSCMYLYQGNFLKKIGGGSYLVLNSVIGEFAYRLFQSVANTQTAIDLYTKTLQSPRTANTIHKVLNSKIFRGKEGGGPEKESIDLFLKWCTSPAKLPPQKVSEPIPTRNDLTVDKTYIQTPLELSKEPSIHLKASLDALFVKCPLPDSVLLPLPYNDEVLSEKIQNSKIGTNREDIIGYLRDGLEKFANTLTYHAPQAGEMTNFKDYTDYRIMIKCCAAKWLEMSENSGVPSDIEDAIINLGLIGHYCNAGLTDVVDAYYTTYIDAKNQSIERRILTLLQSARRRTLDSLFDHEYLRQAGEHVSVQDRHLRNSQLGAFYSIFGEPLPRSFLADKGGGLSSIETLSKIHYLRAHPQSIEVLKKRNSVDFILEVLRDDHRNTDHSQITFEMYENWFSNWYARNRKIPLEEGKQQFRTFAINPDGHIKDGHFRALLVELGILRNRRLDETPIFQTTLRDLVEGSILSEAESHHQSLAP